MSDVNVPAGKTPVEREAAAAKAAVAETPADAKPAAPVAEAIKPERRSFRWYTPLAWTKDFVKGTVLGLSNGLSKGAKMGLKIGLVACAVMFFAPVVPAIATLGGALGLPAVGVGLDAIIISGALYGIGGAVVGTVFAGTMGLLTGGAYELKLRGRREKYAEQLAERAEIRSQQKTRTPHANWRAYANEVKQELRDNQDRQYFFQKEVAAEQNSGNQQSWTDYVMNRHANHDRAR